MNNARELLVQLEAIVAELGDFYLRLDDTSFLANASWTARDVLVHIVFWHQSFARNVSDLANSVKPKPLKGTYAELGQRSAEAFADFSIDELLGRLSDAQKTIGSSISNPRITLIPYKVGSRSYAPAEHLSVVTDHICDHLKKLRNSAAAAEGGHNVQSQARTGTQK
jgi:hypothetical protein